MGWATTQDLLYDNSVRWHSLSIRRPAQEAPVYGFIQCNLAGEEARKAPNRLPPEQRSSLLDEMIGLRTAFYKRLSHSRCRSLLLERSLWKSSRNDHLRGSDPAFI